MSYFKIIHEDKNYIVLEKSPGISVQEDETDINLYTEVKRYLTKSLGKPNPFVGIVHRLDKPVGGLMLFAKRSKAAGKISNQIQQKTLEKTYLAITNGKLNLKIGESLELTNYLFRDESLNITKVVNNPIKDIGKLSLKLIATQEGFNLLEIKLITGKKHQIRAQLTGLNNPIVGDIKYGSEIKLDGQIALWAYKLKFIDPTDNSLKTFINIPKNYPWEIFNTELTKLL